MKMECGKCGVTFAFLAHPSFYNFSMLFHDSLFNAFSYLLLSQLFVQRPRPRSPHSPCNLRTGNSRQQAHERDDARGRDEE